jgi:hypothetical protein
MRPEEPDYMAVYNDHWKPIVENPDGTLNKDQVARELSDALSLCRHLTEIYAEVSNGQVSKPFTLPSVVIAMYHDSLMEAGDQAIRDLIESLDETDDASYTITEVITLIRKTADVPLASDGDDDVA